MNKVKAVVFGIIMSAAVTANVTNEATTVTGEAGKDVRLSLESDPTTGYDWVTKDLLDGLVPISGGYEQSKSCPKGATGCGSEKVLRFTGEKKGGSTPKLTYGRSFDKSSWQEKEVKVVIR